MPVGVLGGCASVINSQVNSDIDLVNSCQEIQANQAGYVPITKEAFIGLVQHRILGDVVRCDDGFAGELGEPKVRSVLFCGLNEEVGRNIALQANVFKEFVPLFHKELLHVKDSTTKIDDAMGRVKLEWSKNAPDGNCARVDQCALQYSAMLRSPVIGKASGEIIVELRNIGAAIDNIQVLANNIEANVLAGGQQDQVLLLADIKRIVANAKSFLNTAQRALMGDVAMVTRDAVLNNLYYQFSNRILDALDTSLLRAEKVLDKADEKLYGSVSLTMYFSQGAIQQGFDKSIIGTVCKASNGKPPPRAAFAIAQAVCERVGDPDRSAKSFLAPMIEKSFVTAVHYASNTDSGNDNDALANTCAATRTAQAASTGPEPSKTAGAAPVDTLPFGLYMAHEWATGLALTTVAQENISPQESTVLDESQKTAMAALSLQPVVGVLHPAAAAAPFAVPAASSTPGASIQKRLVATLPARESVKRLALSSSASALTEFESARGSGGYEPLKGYLTDASSVKSVVTTFLSVQPQSTLVSVNSNTTQNVNVTPIVTPVAPSVFIVPLSQPQSVDFDICANLSAGISCRKIATGSYEIRARRFGIGAFQDQGVKRAIDMVGASVARSARAYDAYISGFASINEFSCQSAAKWAQGLEPKRPFDGAELTNTGSKSYQLSYRSASGASYFKATCDNRSQIGGNAVLSFARAAWTGSLLEAAPGAQVRIMDVVGVGADYASPTDISDDRWVRIRLIQR